MPRWAQGAVLVGVVVLGAWLVMFHWNGKAQSPAMALRDTFAADRAEATPTEFDGDCAMGYLRSLCKIGPRISGTEGMKKQQNLLEKHFRDRGGAIRWQTFDATQRSVRKKTPMANLIVSWHPDRKKRVILCSHYDTRPQADQEHDTRRWREPFLSANDGGSGVALLMELAHHLKDLQIEVGVDFVFFDGEEFVYDRDDKYFFGSEHFGRSYRRDRGDTVYQGAILLDMVGGKDAHFPIEQTSWRHAPNFVQSVWAIAEQLQCSAFDSSAFSKQPILDDHVALNQAGIPAIDIIDFDYAHWHRLTDVPEQCSGETMAQVARVVSVWLQRAR
jgi:hypothetical protein